MKKQVLYTIEAWITIPLHENWFIFYTYVYFYITLLLISLLIVVCVSVLRMVCHHQTCQLSLIQSETQAIAPSKIRLQSEKEWENSKTYCCNFKQLYIYYYFQISLYNRLPHLRLAGLATINHITIPCMCSLLSSLCYTLVHGWATLLKQRLHSPHLSSTEAALYSKIRPM